ncbi:FAD-dependent oxidoreductase [Pusillimonas caeni]|uniref:FAD-dependent monooxygenase n=1 Tax=Pusillimonas caeni TaxID=1348472 RepID=UPI000E59B758|nr:FAD-dependent monooxygenase [Pusillimonas caeni]TFL13192.1 FAD-dependent oxidoreductase [Pusillimonas caeni]
MDIVFSEYFPYDHYEPKLPPLEGGAETARHRVVIAGGGPTGLALALDLALQGIPSVVLEADATVCTGSRASAFTRRTMEILDRLGIIDEVLDTSLSWKEGWTFHGLTEIARMRLPDDDSQKYPPSISQLQNYVEHCMARKAERDYADLIDIRWQSKLQDLQAHDHGVSLEVDTPLGSYRMQADWLVACDGGQSFVRSALGLRMRGKRHAGRYVIIDIRLNTDDMRAGRHCWFSPPSLPSGTLLMYKQPRGMLRFDYQIREDQVEWASKPEEVFKNVQQHLDMQGITEPWEPVWLSLYRASALTLDNYCHGRVLFAGDAAHLVPIFGVRGMNSAVEDVHNLAWKLALVLQGKCDASLLQSYSQERIFAAEANHRYASRGAEFMAPPSAPHKLMRDAVLTLAPTNELLKTLVIPRQHTATVLSESPLTVPDAGDAFRGGPLPGGVLPECRIRMHDRAGATDCFLTDTLGSRFDAFYFTESGEVPAAIKQACEQAGRAVPFALHVVARQRPQAAGAWIEDHTGKLFSNFDAVPGTLYIVRPDGHTLGRWRQARAADILAAVQRLPLTNEVVWELP